VWPRAWTVKQPPMHGSKSLILRLLKREEIILNYYCFKEIVTVTARFVSKNVTFALKNSLHLLQIVLFYNGIV
jgi:hypothetical protein